MKPIDKELSELLDQMITRWIRAADENRQPVI